MVLLRRRLACCTWNREINNSIDFDKTPYVAGIMTYNGLESCIMSVKSCEDESVTSRGDECATNSVDEDASNSSSINDVSGSLSSHWMMMKTDEQELDEWQYFETTQQCRVNASSQIANVEIMKETFAKLLLGGDTTGGSKGLSSALALSNSITKLAQSIFGELWKLVPLSEETKSSWRTEMDWLLSPTNYMVELVPAKQYGSNGRALEIMRPKARADVHMNLPALRKLDSLLLETLDAMTNTEFWYEEGNQDETKNKSVKEAKMFGLPVLRVPIGGLSDYERKRLLNQAKLVHQIYKAAKSINESILHEMPIPKIIGDALPKSGKENLGDDLYRTLNTGSFSALGLFKSLNITSEHSALDTINKLEAAIYAWKERIMIQTTDSKSPARTLWSIKDPSMELNKIQFLINRVEVLLLQIRNRYPNLPQTFLDAMKIQYGKDIAYAILEAYSRVLGNLAFNILARIEDICREDVSVDPNSPMATNNLPEINVFGITGINMSNVSTRYTLYDKMNNIEGNMSLSKSEKGSYTPILDDVTDLVMTTQCRRSRHCIGKDVCFTSSRMSP